LFRRLARCTVPVIAYLTFGIYLMGETATRILFQRGAFDAQNVQQVSWLWLLLSLSLFPHAFGTFIAKFCQALRGAGSTLVSGIILFAATWIVAWYGASLANLGIISLSVAASIFVTSCFWLFWLAKRLDVLPILKDIASALLRVGLILTPAIAVERWSSLHTQDLSDMLGLLICGSLYSLTTILLLIATRSQLWFLAKRPGEA
jgi:peptidoglycan biosynthesis protein MviN/MurJ (putative lipid II flippase)